MNGWWAEGRFVYSDEGIIAACEGAPSEEEARAKFIAAAPALADVWDNLSDELRAYILSEAPEWVGKSIRAWVGARTL